jgi:hypothetical protein
MRRSGKRQRRPNRRDGSQYESRDAATAPSIPARRPTTSRSSQPATAPVSDLRRRHAETRRFAYQSGSSTRAAYMTGRSFFVPRPVRASSAKNTSICSGFASIGETGFEPATARPRRAATQRGHGTISARPACLSRLTYPCEFAARRAPRAGCAIAFDPNALAAARVRVPPRVLRRASCPGPCGRCSRSCGSPSGPSGTAC